MRTGINMVSNMYPFSLTQNLIDKHHAASITKNGRKCRKYRFGLLQIIRSTALVEKVMCISLFKRFSAMLAATAKAVIVEIMWCHWMTM